MRPTPTQAGLSNTRAPPECGQGLSLAEMSQGKRILLIDDVMTTGATAAACALALKQAGASRVALLTVARVDRRMEGWRLTADHSMVEGKLLNGE